MGKTQAWKGEEPVLNCIIFKCYKNVLLSELGWSAVFIDDVEQHVHSFDQIRNCHKAFICNLTW